MKNRFIKAFSVLLLVLTLCISLTGCDKQTYWTAINLYNAGKYDAAATLFSELDGYKDSGQLQTLCRYWEAITFMEEGAYSTALPRFIKLGNYEDSAERAIECKYQMAIAAFEDGDFQTAESQFLEQPQYRQTQEYLRRINCQKLFDAITEAGGNLENAQDGTVLRVTTAEPAQLLFSVSVSKDMGYTFYDDLTLALTRDSLEADFIATGSFDMDYLGEQIGSTQTASGKVNISSCAAGMYLTVDTFQMTVTDNQGNISTSEDPADCLMADDMSENLSVMLARIPQLLNDAGITLTLADIGFISLA